MIKIQIIATLATIIVCILYTFELFEIIKLRKKVELTTYRLDDEIKKFTNIINDMRKRLKKEIENKMEENKDEQRKIKRTRRNDKKEQ